MRKIKFTANLRKRQISLSDFDKDLEQLAVKLCETKKLVQRKQVLLMPIPLYTQCMQKYLHAQHANM